MRSAERPPGPGVLSPEQSTTAHVRASRALIARAAALAPAGFAAVLGSGAATEIPIAELADHFDAVELVDCDGAALARARQRYGRSGQLRRSLWFTEADLTGTIRAARSASQEIVARATGPGACLEELVDLLDRTRPSFFRPGNGQGCALVVCSGVLSQLQSGVRRAVREPFVERFADAGATEAQCQPWKRAWWRLARRLESSFLDHVAALLQPGGVLYLADTVHACWLEEVEPGTLGSTGAWLALRSPRLADYVHEDCEVLVERGWPWYRLGRDGAYLGRLYGVQALICRPARRSPASG